MQSYFYIRTEVGTKLRQSGNSAWLRRNQQLKIAWAVSGLWKLPWKKLNLLKEN